MKRFLKFAGLAAGVSVLFLVAAYFIVGSGWFIRSQVFPRVQKATGVTLTADGVAFSPLSQLELTGFRASADPAAAPLATAKILRVRYSALALLGGTLKVDDVLVDGLAVTLEKNADGSWKLPALPAAAAPAPAAPAAPGKKRPPFRPEIRNIDVRDFSLTVTQAGAEPARCELRKAAFKLTEFVPGKPAKAEFEAEFSASRGAAVRILKGQARGALELTTCPDLLPQSLTLTGSVTNLAGQIQGIPLPGHELHMTVRAETGEGGRLNLRECRLEETAGGQTEAALKVEGGLVPAPLSGDFRVTLDPVSPAVFTLVGGLVGGLDFGQTSGRYTGQISLRNGGVAAKGELSLSRLTVRSPKLPAAGLPPMELALIHDIQYEPTTNRAAVNAFQMRLNSAEGEVLRMELSEPIILALDGTVGSGPAEAPARFRVKADRFDLALLAPFLPQDGAVRLLGGKLAVDLETVVASRGRQIDCRGTVTGSAIRLADAKGGELPPVAFRKEFRTSLNEMRRLTQSAEFHLTVRNQPALDFTATAAFDLKDRAGSGTLRLGQANPLLLELAPQLRDAGIRNFLAGGNLAFTVTPEMKSLALRGDLAVNQFQVAAADGRLLPAADLRAEVDATLEPDAKQVRATALSLTVMQQQRAVVTAKLAHPAAFSLSPGGRDATAELDFTVNRFDLVLVSPFLPKDGAGIRSGELSGSGRATVAGGGRDLSLRAEFNTSRLVITTAQGETAPLAATLTLDAGCRDSRQVELRNAGLSLTAAGRPALQVAVKGALDLKERTGTAELNLESLTVGILQALPEQTRRQLAAIQDFQAGGKFTAEFRDQGRAADLRGSLAVTRLLVLDTESGELRPPVQGSMDLDLSLTPERELRIRRSGLSLLQNKMPVAYLHVFGSYFLPPAKRESVLEITSNGIDAKLLASLAGKKPAAKPPAAPTPAMPPAPTVEPAPIDLGGLWLTVALELTNITYGEITAAVRPSLIRIKDNRIETKSLNLTLNGTPIQSALTLDLSRPGWQYAVKTRLTGLLIDPFINSFAPESLRGKVSGRIQLLDLDLTGAGITPPNLKRNFNGGTNLVMDSLVIQDLPFQESLAGVNGIPELKKIVFDTVNVRLASANGRMELREVAMIGPMLRLDATGSIGFDQTLDLKTRLGVGDSLEQRLRQNAYVNALLTNREGNYTILPLTYKIGGTMTKPEYEKNIVNLLAQAAGNVLKDKLLNPDTLQKVSEQLLTPTGKNGKPDWKGLGKSLLQGQSTSTARIATPTTQLQPAPTLTTPTAKTAAPKSREQQLLETGGSLFNDFLKKK